MNIADLVTTHRPELRRVGIHFDQRAQVVAAAKRIYIELGIPCDLEDNDVTYPVPRIASAWYQGAFERLTGHPAYNEWDRAA